MNLAEGLQILLGAVYMLAFIYGIVLIFEASWKLKSSQIAESLNGILAALFLAMGPSLIRSFFTLFGLPGGFDI